MFYDRWLDIHFFLLWNDIKLVVFFKYSAEHREKSWTKLVKKKSQPILTKRQKRIFYNIIYYVTPSFKCVGYKSRYDSNHCAPHNILEFDKKKIIIITNVIFLYNMCIIYYTHMGFNYFVRVEKKN